MARIVNLYISVLVLHLPICEHGVMELYVRVIGTHHRAAPHPQNAIESIPPSCRYTAALAFSSAKRYALPRPPPAASGCRGGGVGAERRCLRSCSSIPSDITIVFTILLVST